MADAEQQLRRENGILTPFSRLPSAFLGSPYSLATLQGAREGRGGSWFGWINLLLLFLLLPLVLLPFLLLLKISAFQRLLEKVVAAQGSTSHPLFVIILS